MARLLLRHSRRSSLLPSPLLSSHLHTTPCPPPFSSLLETPKPSASPSPSPSQSPPSSNPHVDDFLSRFIHRMKRPVLASFPGIDRATRDAVLLSLASRLAPLLRPADPLSLSLSGTPSSLLPPSDEPLLPPHLLAAAWDAASASLDDMRRVRRRDLMRRFLQAGAVKGMCRFASEVGIRGDKLREFRFKWAQEELEEWELLEGLRQRRGRDDDDDDAVPVDGEGLVPERKGEMRYRIRGLDLSGERWMEATERVEEAEGRIAEEDEEVKPVMGRSRVLMERILEMDGDGDVAEALKDWAEVLEPRRADWLRLLDRIRDRNRVLYVKVAEVLLDEESFQSTIRDYSRLLEFYSNENKMEDAERILQKMTDKDIKPDILTSIILVHLYSRAGNINRGKEEFESLRKQGFQPDYKVYESMLRAHLKAGNARDAEILMREMENHDMKPSKEIFVEILRVFSQRGQVDGAQRIVYTMQYAGIPQTLESSTLLIEAYGRAGDPEQARNSFDLMMRSGLRPDDRSAASVIAAYEKKNLLDKALDLLLKLEKDGFKPGIQTYSVLVDWLGRLLLVDEVEQLLEKIAERGDVPFNTHVGLCDMYSRVGIEDKAQKSLKILLAKKELLGGVEFERIIDGLLAGGFTEEAKRVNDIMQVQGFESSEATKLKIMRADVIPTRKPRSH